MRPLFEECIEDAKKLTGPELRARVEAAAANVRAPKRPAVPAGGEPIDMFTPLF